MDDFRRKAVDHAAAIATAEITLDAYNQALQALNATLTLINESFNQMAITAFHEINEGMKHLGHAYSVILSVITEEPLS